MATSQQRSNNLMIVAGGQKVIKTYETLAGYGYGPYGGGGFGENIATEGYGADGFGDGGYGQ